MDANVQSEIIRRPVSPRVAHLISGISFYQERGFGLTRFRHAAPLALPLVLNLGTPFRIALGRQPGREDDQPSFGAGLFPGPVLIESGGGAKCIQIDFTPLGAYRFYGGAASELTGQMVSIEDVLGPEGRRFNERVVESSSCQRRFEIVEDFIFHRAVHEPSPEIAAALHILEKSAGSARIQDIVTDIGWSRRHLSRRFINEIGLAPKAFAQMLRFHRACGLARTGAGGWAAVAAEAGYADQAHLTRAFRVFAGETPSEWAKRMALADQRMLRDAGG